mmetsp:Transcript_4701/g.18817  ORF Transcript_4701/g.18817 Transcript_4701/m.18817 type:complete len:252 (+) Transcript_4701:268-1023(+)
MAPTPSDVTKNYTCIARLHARNRPWPARSPRQHTRSVRRAAAAARALDIHEELVKRADLVGEEAKQHGQQLQGDASDWRGEHIPAVVRHEDDERNEQGWRGRVGACVVPREAVHLLVEEAEVHQRAQRAEAVAVRDVVVVGFVGDAEERQPRECGDDLKAHLHVLVLPLSLLARLYAALLVRLGFHLGLLHELRGGHGGVLLGLVPALVPRGLVGPALLLRNLPLRRVVGRLLLLPLLLEAYALQFLAEVV